MIFLLIYNYELNMYRMLKERWKNLRIKEESWRVGRRNWTILSLNFIN